MKKKWLVGAIALFACLSFSILIGCKDSNCENKDGNSSLQNSESSSSFETETEIKETYTLSTASDTDEYGQAGEYTIYDQQKLTAGEKITVSATVNDGYNFAGWYINDICVSEDLEFTYTMKKENVVLEAVYNYYTVNTSCQTNEYGMAGSYTEYSEEKVSIGKEVTVVASVSEGYNFEGWYLVDEWGNVLRCMSEELSYTFTMNAKNIFLKAEYSYYTVTSYSDTDEYGLAGAYTKYANQKISAGEEVSLTATVNKGYNFEGWYIWDTCVSKDLEYTFAMEEQNVKVEARYNYYTVYTWSDTSDYGMAGSYTVCNNEKISLGETVILTATAQKGYNFVGWYINNTCINANLTYTFVMEGNVSVEARYSYYTVSTDIGIGVTGAAYTIMTVEWGEGFTHYNKQKISIGEEVTLKVAEQDGYKFRGWYTGGDINSRLISTSLEFTFIMKEQNIGYVAIFEKI